MNDTNSLDPRQSTLGSLKARFSKTLHKNVERFRKQLRDTKTWRLRYDRISSDSSSRWGRQSVYSKSKQDILPSQEILDVVAKRVSLTPSCNTIEELVGYLVYGFEDVVVILRSLFLWLSSRNSELDSIKFSLNSIIQENIRDLLNGQQTYAEIFSKLCQCAGIECQIIKGYVKTDGYDIGSSIEAKQFETQWNLVKVGDEGWRLINCEWAARGESSRNGSMELADRVDDHYFLTDPEEYIFEFFPLDPCHQLLVRPLTMSDYIHFPVVRSMFFRLGLLFRSHDQGLIFDDSGHVEVQINIPEELENRADFRTDLRFSDGNVQYGETRLNRFALEELNHEQRFYRTDVFFPRIETYQLEIYGRDLKCPEDIWKRPVQLCCKYKIVCRRTDIENNVPLPMTGPGVFGLNNVLKCLNATIISRQDKYIKSVEWEDEVVILFREPMSLRHMLKGENNVDCPQNAMVRMVGNNLIARVRLPSAGLFALSLFGAPQRLKTSKLPHLAKFLFIGVGQGPVFRPIPFPHGDDSSWGPRPLFEELGMSSVSHPDPYIVNPNGDQFSIDIRNGHAHKLSQKYSLIKDGDVSDMTDYIFQNKLNSSTTRFILRFPKPGFYHLTISAVDDDDDDVFGNDDDVDKYADKYPNQLDSNLNTLPVYNYLIEINYVAANHQYLTNKFPAVLAPKSMWSECSLEKPLTRLLTACGDVSFDIAMPRADCLYVVQGRCAISLKSGESGRWQGQVAVSEDADTLTVLAIFSGEKIIPVLEYTIDRPGHLADQYF